MHRHLVTGSRAASCAMSLNFKPVSAKAGKAGFRRFGRAGAAGRASWDAGAVSHVATTS